MTAFAVSESVSAVNIEHCYVTGNNIIHDNQNFGIWEEKLKM